MTKQETAVALTAKVEEQRALLARGDEMTQEDLDRAEALRPEINGLQEQLDRFHHVTATLQAGNAAATQFLNTPVGPPAVPTPVAPAGTTQAPPTQFMQPPAGAQSLGLPAHVRRGRAENFRKLNRVGGPNAEERAYNFGLWLMATLGRNPAAFQRCQERGIELFQVLGEKIESLVQLAHVGNINVSGGFLVPVITENDLIDLRESYGVVRKLFRNRGMTSDTHNIPRRSGGLTAYFANDNVAATESTKSWDNVELVAKKIIALAKLSSELSEDGIIDVADDLAGEIAFAFANKEDLCGFLGDGTSTYGQIVGACYALYPKLSATVANIAGLVVATGTGYATDYSSVTLADFNKVKGKLPAYAYKRGGGPVWVCNSSFFFNTMERLALAAGGVTSMEVVAGIQTGRPMFLGFPVEWAQVMPSNAAINQVACLFGNFPLGAEFGDRRRTTIAVSEHSSFASDVLDIKGTERFDINVHDVGNASATAPLRQAGPVTGLITAAS